jgi:hypothetical protein
MHKIEQCVSDHYLEVTCLIFTRLLLMVMRTKNHLPKFYEYYQVQFLLSVQL